MYDFKLSSFVLIMAAESLSASVVIAMVEQAKNTRCFFFVYHLPWQQHHHWHINHEYLRSIIASLHQKPYINGSSLFDVA